MSGRRHICSLWVGHDGAHVCGHCKPSEHTLRIIAHVEARGTFPEDYKNLQVANALRAISRRRVHG